jgi:hypothetical protein
LLLEVIKHPLSKKVKYGTRFGLFKIKGDIWLIAPPKGKFVSFERQYS